MQVAALSIADASAAVSIKKEVLFSRTGYQNWNTFTTRIGQKSSRFFIKIKDRSKNS